MMMAEEQQLAPKPLGVIVPLLVGPNFSAWYEYASIAKDYSARLKLMALVPVNQPLYTEPTLAEGISMLANSGISVLGYIQIEQSPSENMHLVSAYRKYYPGLAGIAIHEAYAGQFSRRSINQIAAYAKSIGFSKVIANINVTSNEYKDADSLLDTVPENSVDIAMMTFYRGIPEQIQNLKSAQYGPERFAIAVSGYKIESLERFKKMVKAVVSDFAIARYIYISGGRDTIRPYHGVFPPFDSISPYLKDTLQTLDKIASAEQSELNNLKHYIVSTAKKAMRVEEEEEEDPFDEFGIKKQYASIKNNAKKRFLVPQKTPLALDIGKPSVTTTAFTNEFDPKGKYVPENIEWTVYLRYAEEATKRKLHPEPETPFYSFRIAFVGIDSYYELHVTWGGFVRLVKTAMGTAGQPRPGNGTTFPLTNWLGFKVAYHQYPDPDNREDLPYRSLIELYMDEHAQDPSGKLVIGNQADSWRQVFRTEDAGNWLFAISKLPKGKTKTKGKSKGKGKATSYEQLKAPLTGPINGLMFRPAMAAPVDVKFMSIRELEPLKED